MAVSGDDPRRVEELVAAWFGDRAAVEPLAGDGFSGSLVFRVSRPAGDGVVLKSFPAAMADRAGWVHDLVAHVRSTGCPILPALVPGPGGGTLVADRSGRLWEAATFVPGSTAPGPTAVQAAAAARAVAAVHVAAASWAAAPPRLSVPPAILRRIAQARRILAEPWHGLRPPPRAEEPLVAAVAARLVTAAAIALQSGFERAVRGVADAVAPRVPVQAVLRDVWHGHVIHAAGDPGRVAGIVDPHAAAVDTPATDLARLLGSWDRPATRAASETWGDALEAYASVRVLSSAERRLVPWLDATGTICALDNWFRWTVVEGRRFVRPARVVERIDRLLDLLPHAAATLARAAGTV